MLKMSVYQIQCFSKQIVIHLGVTSTSKQTSHIGKKKGCVSTVKKNEYLPFLLGA